MRCSKDHGCIQRIIFGFKTKTRLIKKEQDNDQIKDLQNSVGMGPRPISELSKDQVFSGLSNQDK